MSNKNEAYGKNIGLGQSPALFISDMQCAYTDPSYPRGSDMKKEVAVINKLIAMAREKHIPIIYSMIAFTKEELKSNLWVKKIPGLADLSVDSQLVSINPALNFQEPGDKVIRKNYPSAFFHTELDQYLKEKSIDTLIITGCSASGCVRTTAIDALQYGYRPIVIADAVADRWQEAYQQSIFDLQAKYADVMSSLQILEMK